MPNSWYSSIPVTQEVIDEGVVGDSGHCVIAEAIKAAQPLARRVAVDLQTIRYTLGDKRYIHLTPPRAQHHLLAFDNGLRDLLEPFSLRLATAVQTHEAKQATARKDRKARVVRTAGGTGLTVRGGKPLPTQFRTGRIRKFGLRSMGRSSQS